MNSTSNNNIIIHLVIQNIIISKNINIIIFLRTNNYLKFKLFAQFMKNQYKQRSIPFITRELNNSTSLIIVAYSTNPQALQLFASVKGKIAVISIAGPYRSGKSFLLNTLFTNYLGGLSVQQTSNSSTKGITIWGRPFSITNSNNEMITIFVLDSEGLGSAQQDSNHDTKIFSMIALMSSIIMLNSIGPIHQPSIDSFGSIIKALDYLEQFYNKNSIAYLYWIIRDFELQIISSEHQPKTSHQYLDQSLNFHENDTQSSNRLRKAINTAFRNKECVALGIPHISEQKLQNLNQIPIDQLRPEFVEQIINLRKNIFSNVKQKTINGKLITGQMLCHLINLQVSQINNYNRQIPSFATICKHICEIQCLNYYAEIQTQIEQFFWNIPIDNIPKTRRELLKLRDDVLNRFKQKFANLIKQKEQINQYLIKITQFTNKKIKILENTMKRHNVKEVDKFLKIQFKKIDNKVKSQILKSLFQIGEEFSNFYSFCKKNCPYKDEFEYIFQFIIKKYQESSIHFHKNLTLKLSQQIQQLNIELQSTRSQFKDKQQMWKTEQKQYQFKISVLENNFEIMQKNNLALSHQYELLQQKTSSYSIRTNYQNQEEFDQLQMKNIQLTREILKQQEILSQQKKQSRQTISMQKTEIMLKDFQLTVRNKELSQEKYKSQSLKLALENLQIQKQKAIEQINVLFQQEKINLIEQNQVSKQSIKNLNQQLQCIRNLIMSKNIQINELQSKIFNHQQTIQQNLSQYSHQLQKVQNKYNNMLNTLEQEVKIKQTQIFYQLNRINQLQNHYSTKYSLHINKLQMQNQTLKQKIQLINSDLQIIKNKKYQREEQIGCYLNIIEQKQRQIIRLQSTIDQITSFSEGISKQNSKILKQLNEKIKQKDASIIVCQKNNQNFLCMLNQAKNSYQAQIQKLQTNCKNLINRQQQLNQQNKYIKDTYQKMKLQNQLQKEIKQSQFQKYKQTLNQTIERNLISLKNSFQMGKQIMQTKYFQEGFKYKQRVSQLEALYKKNYINLQTAYKELSQIMEGKLKVLNCQFQNYKQQIVEKTNVKDSEWLKKELQFQMKNSELESMYNSLKKEYQQMLVQKQKESKTNKKKNEDLQLEVLRKQKEIFKLTTKKQALQSNLAKKNLQIQTNKKMMNEQIELILSNYSDIQNKYQKLNEQYVQFRIQLQKQLALEKQKNEFLNSRLEEINTDQTLGSSKFLQDGEKKKNFDLKIQLDKYRQQISTLEQKIEISNKAQRQNQINLKKQVKCLSKENQALQQQLQNYEHKKKILQEKINNYQKQLSENSGQNELKVQNIKGYYNQQVQKLKMIILQKNKQLNEQQFTNQKQISLLKEEVIFSNSQNQKLKDQLLLYEQKYEQLMIQIKKINQRKNEQQQIRINSVDKRAINKVQTIKDQMNRKISEYNQIIKIYKAKDRQLNEENQKLIQKLKKTEKRLQMVKKHQQQNVQAIEQAKRINQIQIFQLLQINEEYKKKNITLEKKLDQLQKKNNQSNFRLERQQCQWKIEKSKLEDHLRQIKESKDYKKRVSHLINRYRSEQKIQSFDQQTLEK